MVYSVPKTLIEHLRTALFDCFVDSDGKIKSLVESKDLTMAIPFLNAMQEPVSPKIDSRAYDHCGACDCILFRSYVFCPNCGRKIAWIE